MPPLLPVAQEEEEEEASSPSALAFAWGVLTLVFSFRCRSDANKQEKYMLHLSASSKSELPSLRLSLQSVQTRKLFCATRSFDI